MLDEAAPPPLLLGGEGGPLLPAARWLPSLLLLLPPLPLLPDPDVEEAAADVVEVVRSTCDEDGTPAAAEPAPRRLLLLRLALEPEPVGALAAAPAAPLLGCCGVVEDATAAGGFRFPEKEGSGWYPAALLMLASEVEDTTEDEEEDEIEEEDVRDEAAVATAEGGFSMVFRNRPVL